MMGARGVTDVSALAAKQALPTFLGYIKVTTDRIIYTYFLYNSLCFCASLSHSVCVWGCVCGCTLICVARYFMPFCGMWPQQSMAHSQLR